MSAASSLPRPWLVPLAALFGAGAAARTAAYRHGWLRRGRLRGPVVSVGNLAVGGSGKTPVVAWVAATLRDAGLPVAILSRGYGGRFEGEALVVGDGETVRASAVEAGDEPVMLAADVPGVIVAVGRHRDVVGRVVEERFGPRVHVLDDGFQHLRLHRDLDLLCVDVRAPGGWPLPAGWLREFPSAASRADLVLLTGADRASEAQLRAAVRRFGEERAVVVETRRVGLFDLAGRPAASPRRPFAVCGIARPERFVEDVRAQAGEIAGARAFPDHHPFTPEDQRRVRAEARAAGADAVVTTAKDAVRWASTGEAGAGAADAAAGPPTLVLRIAAQVREPERLRRRLLALDSRLGDPGPAAARSPGVPSGGEAK